MDCEKFESAMMDELYGELDELTSAAAKRHVAGCARCTALARRACARRGGSRRSRWSTPRQTSRSGSSPRRRDAQKVVPLRRRVARVVSLAGSVGDAPADGDGCPVPRHDRHERAAPSRASRRARRRAPTVTVTEQGRPPPASPRPSTIRAGPRLPYRRPPRRSSRDRVEAKPADAPSTPATCPSRTFAARATRKGAPAKEKDDDGLSGMANASAPRRRAEHAAACAAGGGARRRARRPAGFGQAAAAAQPATGGDGRDKKAQLGPFDTALQSYRAGRFDDATRSFDALAGADANAELWAARSVRESKGCRNALARFDKVARRAAGSPPGWDALLEGALCYRAIGNFGQARVRLTAAAQGRLAQGPRAGRARSHQPARSRRRARAGAARGRRPALPEARRPRRDRDSPPAPSISRPTER